MFGLDEEITELRKVISELVRQQKITNWILVREHVYPKGLVEAEQFLLDAEKRFPKPS